MKLTISKATAIAAVAMGLMVTGNAVRADDSAITATNGASAHEADNSGRNVRDRHNATLTPGDQSKLKSDRDLTQKIRRAITSGTNHFSMEARNVKIITQNGKVTLRGPVKTEEEKSNIEAIAKAQGGSEVDDQLEVKGQ